MALEAPAQRSIWIALALAGLIVFRVNTGKAWARGAGPVRRLPNGDVLVPGGRPVSLGFGLINGDPVVGVGDLCGWQSITVTPDMVGCRVAVFASVECKRTDGGVLSTDQAHWIASVTNAGGIAGVASSPEEAKAIVDGWRPMRFGA